MYGMRFSVPFFLSLHICNLQNLKKNIYKVYKFSSNWFYVLVHKMMQLNLLSI